MVSPFSRCTVSLAGAVYGLYAREDIVHPDGKTGVLFKKDSLIAQGVIKEDGIIIQKHLFQPPKTVGRN